MARVKQHFNQKAAPFSNNPDTKDSPPNAVPAPHSEMAPGAKGSKVPDNMMPAHSNPVPFLKGMGK